MRHVRTDINKQHLQAWLGFQQDFVHLLIGEVCLLLMGLFPVLQIIIPDVLIAVQGASYCSQMQFVGLAFRNRMTWLEGSDQRTCGFFLLSLAAVLLEFLANQLPLQW